jgi:cytochrome bd ubiquinol oxidase subunit II
MTAPLSLAVAAVVLVAMIAYVTSGGADFGGGIWELFATGPRASRQRNALRDAIAPIWEAHHVWLIVVVVVMFVCFPRAFSAIMVALHVPITLMLFGVVLRGSAFAFRSYAAGDERLAGRWARIFVVSSTVTPFMLGVVAGAIAGGELRISSATGEVVTDYFSAWVSPFPMAIGLLLTAICAYLAAVYMAVETPEPELAEDFRLRGLIAGVAVGAFALLGVVVAYVDAMPLFERLVLAPWAPGFHVVTGAIATAALVGLWRRRYRIAQLLAIVQTALILVGWALAQYPYVIAPDLTIEAAAAQREVLVAVLWVLGLGALLLVPSFAYLYVIFKFRRAPSS